MKKLSRWTPIACITVVSLAGVVVAACDNATNPTAPPSPIANKAAAVGGANAVSAPGGGNLTFEADGPIGALETGTHNSAGVARGFLCGVLVGTTTDSHATVSNSGNETLQCHGTFDPAAFGVTKAVTIEGFPCALFFGGLATESRVVGTPGGRIHLRCKS